MTWVRRRSPVPSLALVILDGWGLAAPGPGNAISLAETPVFDRLWEQLTRTRSSRPRAATSACPTGRWATPRSATSTSAPARSSSRTWPGSTTRSPTAASSRTRRCWPPASAARRSPRGRLHLLGLVSDGGVHSGWEHIEATIELAAQEGVPDVVFHAFTDGRDTLPHGGRGYLARARALAAPGGPRSARSAAATTRWTATRRWERTKLAYDAIVHARGPARGRAPRRRSRPPTSAARPTSSSSRP